LKNEPNLAVPDAGQLCFVQLRDVSALEQVATRTRLIETSDNTYAVLPPGERWPSGRTRWAEIRKLPLDKLAVLRRPVLRTPWACGTSRFVRATTLRDASDKPVPRLQAPIQPLQQFRVCMIGDTGLDADGLERFP
jgi:hypothetical protein